MEKKIFCFDVDGTLADISHRRHWVQTKPKNWAAFNATMHLDKVHDDIAWLARNFYEQGHTVIICSGRGSENREVTTTWLTANQIPFHALYMRAEKDYRRDDIVKIELLQQIIAEFGYPDIWFDDRQQVVDAIRAQGVRVLQVAEGNF